ncbi:MAG: hypothetical protein ACLPUO_21160 [Streptosporangiaceae bacterium]
MDDFLVIQGDPTQWKLSEPIEASALTASGPPLALAVVEPLAGTLLLSCRAAASVVLSNPGPHGAIPSGAIPLAMTVMYLPTAAGVSTESAGAAVWYPLDAADLTALEAEITAAMTQGTLASVGFISVGGSGVVVLNGARLPFVVLAPATHSS